jgi:hypothetical protein
MDKVFEVTKQKSVDKLKQEQAFQQWTYLVPSYTVDQVLKERSELLAEKKTESAGSDKSSEMNQMPPLEPLPAK